jgi:hypothetical protein
LCFFNNHILTHEATTLAFGQLISTSNAFSELPALANPSNDVAANPKDADLSRPKIPATHVSPSEHHVLIETSGSLLWTVEIDWERY